MLNIKLSPILPTVFIEHIKNSKAEIIKAFKSLKKNGHLIINVPAFQHLYSDFDNDVDVFKRSVINNNILRRLPYLVAANHFTLQR